MVFAKINTINTWTANRGQAGDGSFFPLMFKLPWKSSGGVFWVLGMLCLPSALIWNELSVEFSPHFNREPFEDTEHALVIHALLFTSEQPYCCSGQGGVLHPWVGAHWNRCNGACKQGCFGETPRRALPSAGNCHQHWEFAALNFPKSPL